MVKNNGSILPENVRFIVVLCSISVKLLSISNSVGVTSLVCIGMLVMQFLVKKNNSSDIR